MRAEVARFHFGGRSLKITGNSFVNPAHGSLIKSPTIATKVRRKFPLPLSLSLSHAHARRNNHAADPRAA